MASAKPCSSPLTSRVKLSRSTSDPLTNFTEYRHIIHPLQYCTLTRPEIVFVVNQLYQFMHSLTSTHWTTTKRVFRYLSGTIHHGLYFCKGSLDLNAFSESDLLEMWMTVPLPQVMLSSLDPV